jgi:hypothetical protein
VPAFRVVPLAAFRGRGRARPASTSPAARGLGRDVAHAHIDARGHEDRCGVEQRPVVAPGVGPFAQADDPGPLSMSTAAPLPPSLHLASGTVFRMLVAEQGSVCLGYLNRPAKTKPRIANSFHLSRRNSHAVPQPWVAPACRSTPLVLGAMNFGSLGPTTQDEATAIVEAAL